MRNPFRSQLTKDMEKDMEGFATIQDFCYHGFRGGMRPGELARVFPWLNMRTVTTYFTKWKSTQGEPRDTSARRQILTNIRRILRDKAARAKLVNNICRHHRLLPEEVEEILRRPNAIRGLVGGQTQKKFQALKELKTIDEAIDIIDRCKRLRVDSELVFDKAFEYAMEIEASRAYVSELSKRELTPAERKAFGSYQFDMVGKWVMKDADAVADIWKSIIAENNRS